MSRQTPDFALIILVSIVFLGLLGFGLLLPILPFIIEDTGASATIITITLSLYSVGQMIGAPLWGRWSDFYGRKRALAFTAFGMAFFYLVIGLAEDLWVIMVARFLGGLMAGNISVAYAYIADTTNDRERMKAMGLIGAAFGLGFILGPAIGGLLSGIGFDDRPFLLPSILAASFGMLSAICVLIFLPESRTQSKPQSWREVLPKFPSQGLISLFRQSPVITSLIAVNLVVIAFWALLEAIFSIWANRVLDFSPREVAYFFTFIGIVSVAVQGFAIGPLSRFIGQVQLLRISLIAMFLGFVVMAQANNVALLFLAITLLASGNALFNPALSSLISNQASKERQGMVLGLNQGAGSLGRVIGPLFSGALFVHFGPPAPYIVAAFGMAAGFWLYHSITLRHSLQPEFHSQ